MLGLYPRPTESETLRCLSDLPGDHKHAQTAVEDFRRRKRGVEAGAESGEDIKQVAVLKEKT